MDLQELVWAAKNWTDLTQNRGKLQDGMDAVMILQVPKNGGNFLTC